MDDRIYDCNGELIQVGARVLPWPDGDSPAGTVTRLDPFDVDYNDDTGRPEGYGPFVHVRYDDGEDARFDCIVDDPHDLYERPTSFVCEDVEIDPSPGNTPSGGLC